MAKTKKTFCWNCWRDWKSEFLNLAPWEQEQYLEKNPRINPNDYERGRCPLCGARYEKNDLESLWDDFDFDDDEFGLGYDKADWEEDDKRSG